MRVRIKICGITTPEDALLAAHEGADAIGLVFYRRSPRYVIPSRAREIAALLPPFVDVVGVFVNAAREEVEAVASEVGLTVLQFHGHEPPDFCRGWSQRVLKAFRTGPDFSISQLSRYRVDGFLIDAYDPRSSGGTGRRADWRVAVEVKQYGPVVLAGGLAPDNVAEAVRAVRPLAVDVSSGVEDSPGVKNRSRLRAFVRAVHSACEGLEE